MQYSVIVIASMKIRSYAVGSYLKPTYISMIETQGIGTLNDTMVLLEKEGERLVALRARSKRMKLGKGDCLCYLELPTRYCKYDHRNGVII